MVWLSHNANSMPGLYPVRTDRREKLYWQEHISELVQGTRGNEMPKVFCEALIVKDDMVLMVRKGGNDVWAPPGELFRDADFEDREVIRRALKNIGLESTARTEPFGWVCEEYSADGAEYVTLHHIVTSFMGHIMGEKGVNWEWFDPYHLPENVMPETAGAIRRLGRELFRRKMLKLPLDERKEQYDWAMESWHECYAEAGSSFVFGGGRSTDAYIVASAYAGEKPTMHEYGLSEGDFNIPPVETPPNLPQYPDDDIPF